MLQTPLESPIRVGPDSRRAKHPEKRKARYAQKREGGRRRKAQNLPVGSEIKGMSCDYVQKLGNKRKKTYKPYITRYQLINPKPHPNAKLWISPEPLDAFR